MGKTLIYYFRDEFKVYISARDHKKGRQVASDLNVNYIESNEGLANISDILVISVPIENTCDVIHEVAPFMKAGSLMVDVTSVKEGPSRTMAEALPDSVEYIPTHPVFGPRTTRLDNQVIVLTADKKGKWYPKAHCRFSARRSLYGTLPYEETSDGRKQAYRSYRWRNCYGWRPLGKNGYAFYDD